MKRILLSAVLLFISGNMFTYAAGNAALSEGKMKAYEIWPPLFAEDIINYVSQSEDYLFLKPALDEAQSAAAEQDLRTGENLINEVLSQKIGDDDFIYDLYNALMPEKDENYDGKKLALMYAKDAVNAISSGKRPLSAVNFLKNYPGFFNKTAIDLLEKSSSDFDSLLNKTQKVFNLSRADAAALLLAAEVQSAQGLLKENIAPLREKIAQNETLLRLGDRDKKTSAVKQQLSKDRAALLSLKNTGDIRFKKGIYYPLKGNEDKIAPLISALNNETRHLKAESGKLPAGRFLSKAPVSSSKALKNLLPPSVGEELFLEVYSGWINSAGKDGGKTGYSSARPELKQQILKAVKENPDNIGIIYIGGKEIRSLIQDLFENEGEYSLSAKDLLPYIEEWNARMRALANDEELSREYFEAIETAEEISSKERLNRKIQRDLIISPNNKNLNEYVPFNFTGF